MKVLFCLVLLLMVSSACHRNGARSADPSGATYSAIDMTANHRNVEWLVQNSPLVFTGRLVSLDIERDHRGLIVTHNHFDVEEILKRYHL